MVGWGGCASFKNAYIFPSSSFPLGGGSQSPFPGQCPPAPGSSPSRCREVAARSRRRRGSSAATRRPRVPSADGGDGRSPAAPAAPCCPPRAAGWEMLAGAGCRRAAVPPAWVRAGNGGVLWLLLQIATPPPFSPAVCLTQCAYTVSYMIRLLIKDLKYCEHVLSVEGDF